MRQAGSHGRARRLSGQRYRSGAVLTALLVTIALVAGACDRAAPSALLERTDTGAATAEMGQRATVTGEAGEAGRATEEAGAMLGNVHWLGHASFRLTGEKVIYIDPWQLKGGDPADIILITHGHYDHCSPEDVARIRGPQTTVVVAGDCASKLGGELQVVKPGDRITVQGVPVEVVPAYNIGKQYHPRQDNGVGYIVTLNGLRIYHAGDTDHTPEMDAVQADVALLPVGGKYTMTASEAAAAANALRPRVAVPMHWGSVVGSRGDAERFRDECSVPVQILAPERP